MDSDDKVAKGVVGTLIVFASFILAPVWYGYVFSILWQWFIVPVFGLPVLSKAVALGIAVTVRMVTNQDGKDCQEKEKSFWQSMLSIIGKAFVAPAFALLYGYIVKQWM